MRPPRSLRPDPPPRAPGDAPAEDLALNSLERFDSEQQAKTAAGSARAAGERGSGIVVVLGALVLLEAIPAGLWLRAYLAPEPPPAAAAAPATATFPVATPTSVATPVATPVASPPRAVATTALPPCEAVAPAPTGARATGQAARRVAAPPGAPGPAAVSAASPLLAGLVAINAPVPMQVFENGRLVGSSESGSLMLAAGAHDLEFANEEVGFRVRRRVSVENGRTTAIDLDAPKGALHLNAIPWAEVWMGDQRLGETPIGDLQVPIGVRDLTFRHPDLGERRARVLVTLREPARVSVDLRK